VSGKPKDQWQSEHLGIPFETDRDVFGFALQYHQRTEDFDRKTCGGQEFVIVVPPAAKRGICEQNAVRTRDAMYEELVKHLVPYQGWKAVIVDTAQEFRRIYTGGHRINLFPVASLDLPQPSPGALFWMKPEKMKRY